jgi:hypothetical protein
MQVVPIKDVVYTDFQGTGGILVDLKTKQYYQLNETGSLIWRGLEKGNSVDEIAREMSSIYEVTHEHASESVKRLVSTLEMRRLVSSRSE